MGSPAESSHKTISSNRTMKTLLLILLLGAVLLTTQASRVKKLRGPARLELEKEENNKISHGPAYKKVALTDEEFARKKARYYKKLRLGHRGEHRPANTRHDQDDLSLQDLSVQRGTPVITSKHKKTNFNKVMKLKSLKPSKKMEKMYKKMLAKEKMRLKKKHFKKEQKQKQLTPVP